MAHLEKSDLVKKALAGLTNPLKSLSGVPVNTDHIKGFLPGQWIYYRLGSGAREVGPYRVEEVDEPWGVTWLLLDEDGELKWVNNCLVTRIGESE